ncbi:MAG: hypothetical protein U5O69_10360 [Candidatus Competibacteraceae bacterium]|nr:hypothetical protein [Candidatus Competibacteraceae bacterium]
MLNLHRATLTASKTGAGGGAIASSPVGIDCGSACAAEYLLYCGHPHRHAGRRFGFRRRSGAAPGRATAR